MMKKKKKKCDVSFTHCKGNQNIFAICELMSRCVGVYELNCGCIDHIPSAEIMTHHHVMCKDKSLCANHAKSHLILPQLLLVRASFRQCDGYSDIRRGANNRINPKS